MGDIKVSAIVPVFNVPEKFLRRCVESLMAQTLAETEIILVDDGSCDGSERICDEYAARDSRIKVIHRQNGGLSAARNTGVRASSGKYFTFVDGDDWLEKEALAVSYGEAEKYRAEVVLWGTVKDYGKRSVKYPYDDFEDGKIYMDGECKFLQEELLNYNAQISSAYSKLIRKDFVEEYGIYHDEALRQGAEGLEFCLRLFEPLRRALFIKRHFYHYVYNEGSISASHSEENHRAVVACFEKIAKFISCSEGKGGADELLKNRLLYVAVTTAISGYFNPDNREPFKEKKRKYKEFLNIPIIKDSLKTAKYFDISLQRRIILFFIKRGMFFAVAFVAKMNKKRKGKNEA